MYVSQDIGWSVQFIASQVSILFTHFGAQSAYWSGMCNVDALYHCMYSAVNNVVIMKSSFINRGRILTDCDNIETRLWT